MTKAAFPAITVSRTDKLVIDPLYGFGDHLFLRPLVLAASEDHEVYIKTAYPELYRGTKVKCLKPETGQYSFSDKNALKGWPWANHPMQGTYKFIRNVYTQEAMRSNVSVSQIVSKDFKRKVYNTKLVAEHWQKEQGRYLIHGNKPDQPILLVKMPSYPKDWKPSSRSPKLQYLIECIKLARAAGYYVVSMHNPDDVFEEPELIGQWLPLCHQALHKDLTIDQMIGVFAIADAVLSYPNFTLPLCVSLDTPLFTVFGGHAAPNVLIDPRMDPSKWHYVAPNPFCNCVDITHDCNKEIPLSTVRNEFSWFLKTKNLHKDKFIWDDNIGYGYFPVDNTGVYNDAYFDKYIGYEHTPVGEKLNSSRVNLAKKYQYNGRILDIGIGSGQFVRAVDGLGYDVCPKAIQYLKDNDRFKNPWKDDLWGVDIVTFFDSFEHEDDIEGLFERIHGKTIVMSIPIFKDRPHARSSKHFRPDEHYHYFTHAGLVNWFEKRGYELLESNTMEQDAGREDIGTFVFGIKPLV